MRKIDQMIYDLYDLTKKEIDTVENFYKAQNRK